MFCICNLNYIVTFFLLYIDKPVFLDNMEGDPVKLYVFKSDSVNLTCQNSAEPPANMSWSFNDKSFINPTDHYIVRISHENKPYSAGSLYLQVTVSTTG